MNDTEVLKSALALKRAILRGNLKLANQIRHELYMAGRLFVPPDKSKQRT